MPFQPIRLHVSSGASYDVMQSADACCTLREITVGVDHDEDGVPRQAIRIAPSDITRVETCA